MNIEKLINSAILVRKKDIFNSTITKKLNKKEDYQIFYKEFADKLQNTNLNNVDYILQNRYFQNSINLSQLERYIDSYSNEPKQNQQNQNKIISLLSLWFPDVSFIRIIPTDTKKQQNLLIECNAVCGSTKIIFYMRIRVLESQSLSQNMFNQELDYFNEISSYSSRFLSMKYQKVISEHILITASGIGINQKNNSQKDLEIYTDKCYLNIVLSDYCEYSLREILYPQVKQNESIQNEQNKQLQINSQTAININNNTSKEKHSILIEKFSFQHLQKDLVESLFFMHSRGYTHNGISIDSIFYDKYINAFVLGDFYNVKRNETSYSQFKNDIRNIGLVLVHFLIIFYNIPIDQDIYTLNDNDITKIINTIQNNKTISAKKNFILLNLNLYQQRNILFDIFATGNLDEDESNIEQKQKYQSSQLSNQNIFSNDLKNESCNFIKTDKSFDIVELAIALNVQHCLIDSSQSAMKSFLSQNDALDEIALTQHLINPLNNKYTYWNYTGSIKNGVFNGLGEIIFKPPTKKYREINSLGEDMEDYVDDLDESFFNKNQLSKHIINPPSTLEVMLTHQNLSTTKQFSHDYNNEEDSQFKNQELQLSSDNLNIRINHEDDILTSNKNQIPFVDRQITLNDGTTFLSKDNLISQPQVIPLKSALQNMKFHSNNNINMNGDQNRQNIIFDNLLNNDISKISNQNNPNKNELSDDQSSLQIFKGVWENGFNQRYLNFVSIKQFKELFMLNNYLKIIDHNNHLELQFSVQSDRQQSSKTIDLQFSIKKDQVIDSLNILIKYLQTPIARITLDLNGINQRRLTNEAQSIELQSDDGSVIYILFDSHYAIKEEEIYIILERATLSTYLVLQLTNTQISDKFFYGMSFNQKLQFLSYLQISHSNYITDDGFLQFIRNCPSNHLESIDISYTQLTDATILELTTSNKITKLKHLNISFNPLITEKGIIEFIKSSNSFFITHLNLSGLDISDNLIEIFSLSPFMKNISELIMNNCPKLTFKIFEIFTKSDSVNSIKRIELSYSLKHSTTTAAKKTGQYRIIINQTNFYKLQSIDLKIYQMSKYIYQIIRFLNNLLDQRKSKQEFKLFAKTNKLGKLQAINLEGCSILHNHIKQLANSNFMKQLEEINISNCENINDECIKEISTSENFMKLTKLSLSNLKGLTPASIELIGNSKYITHLDSIYLDGCEKIDKTTLINALNFVNFQNLKEIKFDENQYSVQILRQINFSNKNSVQTFWRMQIIQIVITNPDLFFKLYVAEILSFNQKPVKFQVAQAQESQVIHQLATIFHHQITHFNEINCRINVNNISLNDRIIEKFKKQKQSQNKTSYSNADIFTVNKQILPRAINSKYSSKEIISQEQSFNALDNEDWKQENSSNNDSSQSLTFSQMKLYCKNECFKAMSYINFIKDLKKLDLSYSKSINLPGYQYIKECAFFPNLVELNLQNLPLLNKHIQQMCTGIQFTNLRYLNLKNCYSVTFKGLDFFIKSGIHKTVQFLDITNTSIEGTSFTVCLPDFIKLSQLNSGVIYLEISKSEIKDEENIKKKIGLVFERIRSLFYIGQLTIKIQKIRITSQALQGIADVLMDHFNTITHLSIIFCNAKNMNSEYSINFWSSMSQLIKIQSLSLVFEKCENIDKLFLKNLFFGISVLTQMEELHLAFPRTEINISSEDFTPLCLPMTRLQKLQILEINFHEYMIQNSLLQIIIFSLPLVNSQFMEEFVYIMGKLESIKNLSLDYSWNYNQPVSNMLKLLESLETSKSKLYYLKIDFEMCAFPKVIWKKLKKFILSQILLREISLNISYCIELKEKSVVKFINSCLELKLLKILKLNLQGVAKITQKSKESLKQNANLYSIDTFELSIQEIP